MLSVACAILSAACLAAPNWIYPDRPALVHVRWAPGVEDTHRRDLEVRYRLTRPEVREATTWAYYIADTSRSNLRALVSDPAVEDTHNINRTRFSVWRTAPRDPFRGFGASVIPNLLWAAFVFLGAASLVWGLVAVAPGPARRMGTTIWQFAVVAARGMGPPASSPESAGAFRIVFGLSLLALLVSEPITAREVSAAATTGDPLPLFAGLLNALALRPWLARGIHLALLAALVTFVAGLRTRTAYGVVCAGLLVWALVHSARSGGHPFGALVLAVLCLLAAPWGDGWSADAWLRRRSRRRVVERSALEYGYVTWMPGVVLGVCFLAAAVSKLREGGVAWITNGTVKYHFLTDSPAALVDWGLWLGAHPYLAVAVSAAAIGVEAVVILGAVSRSYWRRAVAGGLAAIILVGFLLFQGIFWPGWWVLLLAFLPWHLIARTRAGVEPVSAWSALPWAQVASVAALVAQQLVASAARIEAPPFLSAYDMYSTTYGNPSEYEAAAGVSYWLISRQAGVPNESCEVSGDVAKAWLDESRRGTDPEGVRMARACFGDQLARQFVVEGRRTRVDWDRWRLAADEHQVLGGPFWWRGPSPGGDPGR